MAATARDHARRLLTALHHSADVPDAPDPLTDWAFSGAMALTGRADGPPLVAAGAAVAARGALLALEALAPGTALPDVRLLGERAALSGLSRQGDLSCGGATRLLPTADGHVALSLARPTDYELIPALVSDDGGHDWEAVTDWAAGRTAHEVRDRAVVLGLPVGVPGETPRELLPWKEICVHDGPPARRRAPLVVDLSALWAGPLCASLLGLLGCEVVKVEDPRRPDGARQGNRAFFHLLNAGARSVTMSLSDPALHDLLADADVVIEGSRPRALQQVGVDAEAYAAQGTTWVSITGHGRDQGHRVGYGDDAAVAGGLLAHDEGGPVFVGDAVADPLTGLHAALVAWSGLLQGGGRLVDVALARVAACAAALGGPTAPAFQHEKAWYVETSVGPVAVADPWARA